MTNIADNDTDPMKDDVESLKDDLARLREDLKAVFGDLKGYASAKGQEGVEKGKALASDTGEHLNAAREDLQVRIREKPLAAVGLAFGAGMLLAILNRK